jgi:hypothetical protein
MQTERDYIPIILGLIGLLSIGYAMYLTRQETSGSIFYIFLVIQTLVLLYLLFVVMAILKEAWTNYRWSPDRLR